MTMTTNRTAAAVAEAERWTAHNYHPLPVVIADADGAWVTDVDGRRYLDCLAGYSALNFGHRHPALIDAARKQIEHVTLTSRAFLHDQFGPFCRDLAELCGMDMVLPMNTGAEAVETAIKVSRKWGYKVKGVPDGQASIVVAADNFHGRTTTIISFSTDPDARADYGPYTPGFRIVPYGDLDAMRAAIDETTVAVLIEPIQGEAGVLVPPPGYLTGVRALCTERTCCSWPDEIQSGLGRTGDTFACDHEGVKPDMYVLGKALGGGVVPVSAVVSRADVLGVLRPGEHGSTFGGNPLACAVAIAVVDLLNSGEFQERARELGALLHERLRGADRARRHRRPRSRPVGRHRHRPRADDRARGLRAAHGRRRARQGHPRLDDPSRPAAGGHRGGRQLRGRPAGRGTRNFLRPIMGPPLTATGGPWSSGPGTR
jgi:ornithine--oxo-acid transaminase